jgi:hypothetical protein
LHPSARLPTTPATVLVRCGRPPLGPSFSFLPAPFRHHSPCLLIVRFSPLYGLFSTTRAE